MDGVFAILLAAGESSRMGSLKAMLPWRGVPLIEHQIRCLIDAGVNQVVVVWATKPIYCSRLLSLCMVRTG